MVARRDLARCRLYELEAWRDLWQTHVLLEGQLVAGSLSPPLGGVRGAFTTDADPLPEPLFRPSDRLW